MFLDFLVRPKPLDPANADKLRIRHSTSIAGNRQSLARQNHPLRSIMIRSGCLAAFVVHLQSQSAHGFAFYKT